MKPTLKKLLLYGLFILSTSQLMAADFDERSVSISITNPATRVIKTMPSFASTTISSTNRDQGYVDISGGNLVIQSNDTYKLQSRISGNTLAAAVQMDTGSFTALASTYKDVLTTGSVGSANTHAVTLRFTVDWSSPAVAETTTLYIKVLSRV